MRHRAKARPIEVENGVALFGGLRLAKTRHALAFLPLAALLEKCHALKTLQHIPLGTQPVRRT